MTRCQSRVVGAGGDQRLHGYNGDTGAVIYAGGGPNERMTGNANGTLASSLVVGSTSLAATKCMLLQFREGPLRANRKDNATNA
jgi:hypothetical protein